jgi:hypothetical protein
MEVVLVVKEERNDAWSSNVVVVVVFAELAPTIGPPWRA